VSEIGKNLAEYKFDDLQPPLPHFFSKLLDKDGKLTTDGLDYIMSGLKTLKSNGFKFDSDGKPYSDPMQFLQNVTDFRTEMMAKEVEQTLESDPSESRMLVSVGIAHLGFEPHPGPDGHTYESLNLLLSRKYKSTVIDFGDKKVPDFGDKKVPDLNKFHVESG
jgi:hypothetical protein